jgi:ribonucleoside-diphosphate reductase alpha chain
MAKEGSTISGLMDAFATSISLALQYGVPLRALVDKFSHMRYEPSGFTKNPEIPIAKSITDYIFRWLASRFLSNEEKAAVGVVMAELPSPAAPSTAGSDATGVKFTVDVGADAPSCHECGAIMVRNGSCYKCMNCGSTSGCS